MWRIFGIVATFLGLVFVCRQLNQGWVGPNPPCNERLKMSTCWGIVLQNSANERSVPKMGNIGIQMAGFLNQNAPFRICFRKVFFASGRKKVLQQILGRADIKISRRHFRFCVMASRYTSSTVTRQNLGSASLSTLKRNCPASLNFDKRSATVLMPFMVMPRNSTLVVRGSSRSSRRTRSMGSVS